MNLERVEGMNPSMTTRFVPILPKLDPLSGELGGGHMMLDSPDMFSERSASGRKVPQGRDKYHVIEAIAKVLHEHPAIYQVSHPNHSDSYYLHACWVNMRRRLMQECSANTLEKHNCLSMKDLKNKLHNLRGMFLRQKKKLEKMIKDGEDTAQAKLWMWYKKFEFLNEDYDSQTAVTVTFLTNTPPCSPVHYSSSSKKLDESMHSNEGPAYGYQEGRKRSFDEAFEDSNDSKLRSSKLQPSSSFIEHDETDTFLLFLGSKLRKLPEIQRDEIQMKVLKLVQHEMKGLKGN